MFRLLLRPICDGISVCEPQKGQGIVEYALVIFIFAVSIVVFLTILDDHIMNILAGGYERIASVFNLASNLVSR